METIELSCLDLRLEHTRTRNNFVERSLLQSIAARGILDPLQVAGGAEEREYLLLDGFKRCRCACKLGIGMAPAQCIAGDCVTGIVTMIRRGDRKSGITTLEQAALIEELHKRCGLTIYDIALQLGRSPSWVSVRLGMIEEMSEMVREKIMSGAFPARAYLYGIKGFTRVNKNGSRRVDAFVAAVSGKGLSTRELLVLWRAYFRGGEAMERLILEGDARRALGIIRAGPQEAHEATLPEGQRQYIKDLALACGGINRIVADAAGMREGLGDDRQPGASSFRQDVNLWSGAIARRLDEFSAVIKELYDRSESSQRGSDAFAGGSRPQGDSAAVAH